MDATPSFDDFDSISLPALLTAMQSEHPLTRADAACALGDRLRTRELATLDTPSQDALAALLQDPSRDVRFEAAIALAELHDTRATSTLLAEVDGRKRRLDAIRALGTMGDASAVERLTQIMSGWLMPWADRLQAGAALCALQQESGADYLEKKLRSKVLAERAAAIHFIGESRHPKALSLLASILKDKQDPMRDVAARTIGLVGDPTSASLVEAMLEEALRASENDPASHAKLEFVNDLREARARLAAAA